MKKIWNVLIAMLLCPLDMVAAHTAGPNIVYILADDMGYDSVSALNPSMGSLKTSSIDRLAREGMVFTDAHSGAAVCTPTRYGILTGRYCWRTKLKRSVLWEWGQPLIRRERLTVAELLQQQGYHTGIIGKWHLGMSWLDAGGKIANDHIQLTDTYFRKDDGSQRVKRTAARIDFSKRIANGPLQHGFDSYFGVAVPNFPPYAWIENDRLMGHPSGSKPQKMFGHPGPMVPGWKLDHILPKLAEKACAWIRAHAHQDKPFFLYLPLTSPHSPIAPSHRFKGRSGISDYADFLLETDGVVGEVLESLDQSNISRETLVIFTADNGTAAGFANFQHLESHGVELNATWRGSKGSVYEGGHRVPFIVRWPEKVPSGSRCDETVCLNDFMATVAAMTGAELPPEAAEDSFNILPLLLGKTTGLPNRGQVVHHSGSGQFAIRSGDWKLVLGRNESHQLYHLGFDPKETNDLALVHPDVVSRLYRILEGYQREGRSAQQATDIP